MGNGVGISSSGRAALGGAGISRRMELFADTRVMSDASGAWPPLAFRMGAPTGQPSGGPLLVTIATGTPGLSWGKVVSALGFRMNYPFMDQRGSLFYPINIPLRFASPPSLPCAPLEQCFSISAMLAWNLLGIVPAGDNSGLFLYAWGGLSGGVALNITGVGEHCFGVGLQPATGVFGFIAQNGTVTTFTPITHPAGDIRAGVNVEYRIYNSTSGRAARLEVWINGAFSIGASFAAGNLLGLPIDQGSDVRATYTVIFANDSLLAVRRLWVGDFTYAQGPDDSNMF